ncbi:phosphate/phosphite/phosphonate ABC transporter substrate-binding protein [Spirobacillus cienkowskii]|uniref:phosphate/phosphite/phosphonate ABC transporter substrate-binding protein n=1 Tax=Spirobacillus cienkowskii TaxID=495820 RepID=UPI0030D41447
MVLFFKFIKCIVYLIIIFTFGSCTKLWLGKPELGSKSLPIKLYIDSTYSNIHANSSRSEIQNCLENKTNYRIEIHFASDDKAVVSALARGQAQYGVISAMAYMNALAKTPLKSLLIFSKNGSPSTRAVIIGHTNIWKSYFQKSGLALNAFNLNNEKIIQYFNKSTVAYTAPDNVIGFLVPRLYFLQRNIFPNAAIFVGNFSSVLQALDQNLAEVGVVSENFLDDKFSNTTPIQLGTLFSDYIVLGISQSLPDSIVVETLKNNPLATTAVIKGLETCAQVKTSDFKKLFDADGVQWSQEKLFSFAKELHNFQQETIRILTPKKL